MMDTEIESSCTIINRVKHEFQATVYCLTTEVLRVILRCSYASAFHTIYTQRYNALPISHYNILDMQVCTLWKIKLTYLNINDIPPHPLITSFALHSVAR